MSELKRIDLQDHTYSLIENLNTDYIVQNNNTLALSKSGLSKDLVVVNINFCVISHYLFNVLVFPGPFMFSAASINKTVTV